MVKFEVVKCSDRYDECHIVGTFDTYDEAHTLYVNLVAEEKPYSGSFYSVETVDDQD